MTTAEKLIEKGIEQGIERGIEQGMMKGIEKGIKKGKTEGQNELMKQMILLNYIENKLDIPTISKVLNISEEKIISILKSEGIIK